MRPHDHEPLLRTDIRKLLDLAFLYNETLGESSSYEVHAWINDGCDLERDILPTVKAIIERRHKGRIVSKIDNWRYFTNAVRDATERRLAAERVQAKRTPAAADEGSVHRKAQMAARTVRTFGIKDAIAIRFLEAYEREYGPVA